MRPITYLIFGPQSFNKLPHVFGMLILSGEIHHAMGVVFSESPQLLDLK